MYVMIAVYALLGRTGYILVADYMDPQYALPQIPPPPPGDYRLYSILTYGVLFPFVFFNQWFYFRMLGGRLKVRWSEIPGLDKILIPLYGILAFIFYLFVERIFGVNAPYDHRWDIYVGNIHIWTGDVIGFFIAIPLLMVGFHGINYAVCHCRDNPRQYRFFILVLGTAVLGSIVQDWFWFIADPYIHFGPGTTVGVYFSTWVHVPLTPFYVPLIYIGVSVISLCLFYIAAINLYPFRDYVLFCVFPLSILVVIGNFMNFS